MQKKKTQIPTIIITSGDEAGIGPEIILKALASKNLPGNIKIKVVGSKNNISSTFNLLKSRGVKEIINPENIDIVDLSIAKINCQETGANSGNASFLYLKHAIEIVQNIPNSALVTAPICKKSWALAGHNFSGQTELLAEICNASNVGMLFTAKSPFTKWRFNTLLATTHIPINKVSTSLTEKLIYSKLDLLSRFCEQFNKAPCIQVAGLNPHAGEDGILGYEEKDLIEQVLKDWSLDNKSIKLQGPLSPDSCWIASANAWKDNKAPKHDGVLAMYHDQGLIPVKIIASNYSVNTTIGLPIIRTSPDHGTGFDIAGKGVAQSKSMLEAIKTATDLLTKSNLLDSH